MKKYPIIESEKAFMINDESNEMKWLFLFGSGSDIMICKEQYKSSSQCYQSKTYDYHNEIHPLRGNGLTYSPKRFMIIQMI
jgi:hypothetical protein